jgi:hypothetical protein
MSTSTTPRVLLLAFVAALVASACTSSDSDDAIVESSTSAETTTTVEASTTTVAEAPTADPGDLEALWGEVVAATALPSDERQPAIAALGDAVTPEVGEVVAGLLSETETAEVFAYPSLVNRTSTTVQITDCALYQPQVVGAVNHILTATAESTPAGTWTITELERTGTGCIPGALARPALQTYEEYDEISGAIWNPPDPDHPALEEYVVEDLRETIQGRLEADREEGIYSLFGSDATFREPTEVFAPDWIEITECNDPAPEAGGYYADGTKFTSNGEPVPDDFREEIEIEMVLQEGQWKVLAEYYTSGAPCEPSPSPAGLVVIG